MRWGDMFFLLVALGLGMLIVIVAIFNSTAANSKGFTEFYLFGEFPKIISTNEKHDFKFGLHNAEGKNMFYHYQLTLGDGEELEFGSVYLVSNETKIMNASFFSKNQSGPMKITVELLEKNQRIHFWTEVR